MDALLAKINTALIRPGVSLLFALAMAYFLYGVYEFVKGADDEAARKTGSQHMLWGVVGMAIMITVFGLMRAVCNTIDC